MKPYREVRAFDLYDLIRLLSIYMMCSSASLLLCCFYFGCWTPFISCLLLDRVWRERQWIFFCFVAYMYFYQDRVFNHTYPSMFNITFLHITNLNRYMFSSPLLLHVLYPYGQYLYRTHTTGSIASPIDAVCNDHPNCCSHPSRRGCQ